ncbi:MAG: GNAT family N-acetyltransferase [Rhodovibrionaceae bacterium]
MSEVTLRPAVESDVEEILRMVFEMADYSDGLYKTAGKSLDRDALRVSEADLRRDGFGPRPRFECLIAEAAGEAVGFALFYPNYSTYEGRAGLYLEDIFVRETARGLGVGRRIMRRLATIAVERGCRRLDFSVMPMNPARGFYEALGCHQLDDWLPYRISDGALETLAGED